MESKAEQARSARAGRLVSRRKAKYYDTNDDRHCFFSVAVSFTVPPSSYMLTVFILSWSSVLIVHVVCLLALSCRFHSPMLLCGLHTWMCRFRLHSYVYLYN
ncbi:hypothetical protein BC567DRAFT_21824 [Phyllosticta citribraziliensis]